MEEHIILEIIENQNMNNNQMKAPQQQAPQQQAPQLAYDKLPDVITSGLNPTPSHKVVNSTPISTKPPTLKSTPKQVSVKNITYSSLPKIPSKKRFMVTNLNTRRSRAVMQLGGLR